MLVTFFQSLEGIIFEALGYNGLAQYNYIRNWEMVVSHVDALHNIWTKDWGHHQQLP